MTCWSCGAAIDVGDNFCRRCGQGQGAHIPWYYHPISIILIFFFGMGPFVLPLIWRSPKLGKEGKWAMSLAVVALTAWFVHSAIAAYHALMGLLSGAPSAMPLGLNLADP